MVWWGVFFAVLTFCFFSGFVFLAGVVVMVFLFCEFFRGVVYLYGGIFRDFSGGVIIFRVGRFRCWISSVCFCGGFSIFVWLVRSRW